MLYLILNTFIFDKKDCKMKMIISPAKSLNPKLGIPETKFSQPCFINDALKINGSLKKKSADDLSKLLKISSNLASLNWERNQNFKIPFDQNNSTPSIYFFDGDVYKGIDSESLSLDKLDNMNKRLRILSGLYGILKPLDLIQPYRLEMGTNFAIGKDKNLYEFWRRKITDSLNSELNEAELFIDLASEEYSSVVDKNALKVKTITPKFKDFKNGKLKIISFYAKKARGLMVRYIIDKNVQDYKSLLGFNYEGYAYSEKYTQLESDLFVNLRFYFFPLTGFDLALFFFLFLFLRTPKLLFIILPLLVFLSPLPID